MSAALAVVTFVLPLEAQWPSGQGSGWAKLSVFHHRMTEEYRPDGGTAPFVNNGAESRSTAIYADLLFGVTDRVDVWLQVPYFELNFDADKERRHTSGVGDVRLSARVNILQFRDGSVPVSARLTVKIPVDSLEIDAEVIPVGEG